MVGLLHLEHYNEVLVLGWTFLVKNKWTISD